MTAIPPKPRSTCDKHLRSTSASEPPPFNASRKPSTSTGSHPPPQNQRLPVAQAPGRARRRNPKKPSRHKSSAGVRQNNPSCAGTRRQSSSNANVNNGGSARVIHSFCCPVGGKPASPRKSQTKSQRGPTSGDAQRRQAIVEPGQVPTERH